MPAPSVALLGLVHAHVKPRTEYKYMIASMLRVFSSMIKESYYGAGVKRIEFSASLGSFRVAIKLSLLDCLLRDWNWNSSNLVDSNP